MKIFFPFTSLASSLLIAFEVRKHTYYIYIHTKEERNSEMASFKLITFVPLFILLHLTQSAAHTHGVLAADETGHLVVLRRSLVDVEKEIHDGVPAAVEEAEDTRIGGRKMMPERNLGMVKEEVLKSNGERRLRSASSSGRVKVKVSGFIPFNADYHVPKPHPPKNN